MQQAVGREGAASPGPTHFSPQQMNPVADVDARPSTSHDEPKMHSRRTSKMSIDEIIQGPGRALVQPPRGRDTTDSSTRSRTPSVQYRESEQRQTEQEEARAVRIAMEELELAQEEKLFDAARDEAAELVYKHRNPDAPGKGPTTPYAYPGLAKSSGLNTSPTKEDFDSKDKATESSSLRKAISDLPSFGSRRKSSGSRRKISGSLFSNPNDQIYEEPEEDSPAKPKAVPAATEPPKSEKLPLGIRRNPFMRFQSVKGNPMIRSNTDPVLGNKNFDRYEIQKNPPTQSRNAAYTLNPSVVTKPAEPVKADAENEPEIKMKDGKEIRSDDLRAATGFRLRDRSPHLPTPTMVSDSPGRPIVSFKKGYNEIELKEDVGRGGSVPSISVTPEIPSISVNAAPVPARGPTINAPSISVTPTVPSINVNGSTGSTRPLPDPKHHSSRPFGRGGATTNTRGHWTPTNVRTGALCTQCALPIAGRIVSAAGSRFHPECFACYQCGEHLECVAFYPEPENKLAERIARIHARQRGEDIPYLPTHPTPDDMARLEHQDGTDESQRFFCHLDFHEMFSPRCKSCKTPIEGEVIVACGAEWHAGHFFCAQCGDPFDSSTPFVEKDGYACTKCKKCRKPVTDTVVKALGAEWHVGCFCCVECSGPFQDGRYFLRGESQDPVCVKCEERRLKA
ncbi:hypothetical protein SNOG_07110 [Parastagonospora nodorum SN15]|uniref:LIM zinc-binding domain-containing protein n=1 Tax=Phaeosphaeria nodorum (strain SN15 / ATCC MYA-4574 / FGSC 10173) TaxID=321614 RepID=Q0UMA4_PHANO|nr:hypothetical protein SNOG_07110 [Parastagonospora nodorum SN15]EAT85761.2 hypothetical protein SNOG_07110 [Parastagonospora nodorum SN15]